MASHMRTARLHEPGQPLHIDSVERPKPRANDVLIKVKSSGVIPNMNAIFSGRLWNHLPSLPASVGLDAAGIVAEIGEKVTDIRIGDRSLHKPLAVMRTVCVLPLDSAPALCGRRFPRLLRILPAIPASA